MFLRPAPQEVSAADPLNIVLDFYESWLAAALSTSTDPYREGLTKEPLLSPELRKHILSDRKRTEADIDPVLCQAIIPPEISARPVSQTETMAEVLVLPRRTENPAQAVVKLTRLNEGWYIEDIRCTLGEIGPEREFSFDKEGNLLKSVPAPLNSQYWHLVFEENGQPGHFAPLFFTSASACVTLEGIEGTCDQSQFADAMKAKVQGEMTETGVQVKRLTLLK